MTGTVQRQAALLLLEFCLGTNPIQAEKSRPDRKAIGSATLATRAVAKTGPTPGISSSRRLVSLDRCQALIIRSNSRICAFSIRSWAPRVGRQLLNADDDLVIRCAGRFLEQLPKAF